MNNRDIDPRLGCWDRLVKAPTKGVVKLFPPLREDNVRYYSMVDPDGVIALKAKYEATLKEAREAKIFRDEQQNVPSSLPSGSASDVPCHVGEKIIVPLFVGNSLRVKESLERPLKSEAIIRTCKFYLHLSKKLNQFMYMDVINEKYRCFDINQSVSNPLDPFIEGAKEPIVKPINIFVDFFHRGGTLGRKRLRVKLSRPLLHTMVQNDNTYYLHKSRASNRFYYANIKNCQNCSDNGQEVANEVYK